MDKPQRKRIKKDRTDSSNPKSNGGHKASHGVKNKRKKQFSISGSGSDIDHYIRKNQATKAPASYEVQHQFTDFPLHANLQQNIAARNYTTPTEIQDKAIPEMMNGQDVIGTAGTGTGKTAAFLIPIIQQLLEKPQKDTALIIAPTRELATQTFEEFKHLAKGLKLFATCLIGGESVGVSIKNLRRTNHVIIGTPGRLIDMVNRQLLPLNAFKTLVLDEFDRMLDMGFLEDVQYLNAQMPNKRQTLLFSATMNNSQKGIVKEMTNNAVEVQGGMGPQMTQAIEQEAMRIPGHQKKMDVLHELIDGVDGRKVLLFCETKRTVDQVHRDLLKAKVSADIMHGDKTQKAREKALGKFRKGHTDVLVATDVMARGIDVTDISLVINYEVPRNYNDYMHRIGRTGRAGRKGKAVTLVD